MLKTKAIRKIFTTTLTMFIILTIFTIPMTTKNNKNVLRTNLEIEDVTNLSTNKIYLLNKNNLLVRTEVFIEGKTEEAKIKSIIDYLTLNNDKTPQGLNGYIPENTKVLKVIHEDNNLSLDLSKDFSHYEKGKEEQIITGIVYSLLELENIENITILVEGSYLDNYKTPLNKNLGINNQFLLNSRNDINKVVIYYLNDINNNLYYVPVTKYLNDKRDKIEVIVDELKNNQTSTNLISYLDNNLKLIDYKEESDVLFLNFNDYLLEKDDNINESILNTIAYSAFFNYDVNMVMFEVNDEKVDFVSRKDM